MICSPVLGSAEFTKRTLRFTSHITTVPLVSLGGMLLVLSMGTPDHAVGMLLNIAAAHFLACALVSGIVTRAKHFSWVVFLTIAVFVSCLRSLR